MLEKFLNSLIIFAKHSYHIIFSFIQKKEYNCLEQAHIDKYYHHQPCKNYLKIYWLKQANIFAVWQNKFNDSFIVKLIILITISIFLVFFSAISSNHETFVRAIQQGFFMAPLVNLMMSNQEKVNRIFLQVFFIEENKDKEENELDPYSKKIRKALEEALLLRDTFTDEDKKIWNLFSDASEQAILSRKNFERLNNKTLVLSGFWLVTGYIFFILGFVEFSAFFLFFSLLMVINRLLLGVRSIVKYYLIYKVATLLKETKQTDEAKNLEESLKAIDNIKL